MSIKLQDITTSTNLDLTDKVLVSDGTSEHLVTAETMLGRMHTLFQGKQDTTSVTLTGTTFKKIPLALNGVEVPVGDSGMSISDGGIKVSKAGTYKVTANLYLNPNDTTKSEGVYVFYGTSFTEGEPPTGCTELCGRYDRSFSSVQVIGIATNVSANTIFYLAGRGNSAGTTADLGWLLVERLS